MIRRPPRLVARTMAVTFVTVAVILAVVFLVLVLDARDRVRAAEMERLEASGRIFSVLEARRQHDQLAAIATLAESPTLKAALDTYVAERDFGSLTPDQDAGLRRTVTRETEKLAAAAAADVLAIVDADGRVFASAGGLRDRWPVGQPIHVSRARESSLQGVVVMPAGAFRVSGATLEFEDHVVGTLLLGTSLDEAYARDLAAVADAGVVISLAGAIVARTVPEDIARDVIAAGVESKGSATLRGEEYATRVLLAAGDVRIHTLSSIDAAARSATRDALWALAGIASGSVLLAAIGSVWLARTLTRPIDRVSSSIATMTAAHDYGRRLEPSGSSRELDTLTDAFNELMTGLTAAEAETRAAYVGAIRALAAALDARDPYTAGHSERVSAISVLIARQMGLSDADVDVIRLGALLHDIGKIGVPDEILRKAGPLTPDEIAQIKRHPGLGARILRPVPFLQPHLPIVELHHEQPDGLGYPYGLCGRDIPLAAHIVHVADTFDAMTSARAYRPGQPKPVALAELRRFAGTQFDAACVDAFAQALGTSAILAEPQLEALLGRSA